MNPHAVVVSKLAEDAKKRIAMRAIRSLQALHDGRLSGDDSGLRDAWDEICVQMQLEESFYWAVYRSVVEQVVEAEAKRLTRIEVEAIWLESQEGDEWLDEIEADGPRSDAIPINMGAVWTEIEEVVYRYAEKWSNPRIRRYLDLHDR